MERKDAGSEAEETAVTHLKGAGLKEEEDLPLFA